MPASAQGPRRAPPAAGQKPWQTAGRHRRRGLGWERADVGADAHDQRITVSSTGSARRPQSSVSLGAAGGGVCRGLCVRRMGPSLRARELSTAVSCPDCSAPRPDVNGGSLDPDRADVADVRQHPPAAVGRGLLSGLGTRREMRPQHWFAELSAAVLAQDLATAHGASRSLPPRSARTTSPTSRTSLTAVDSPHAA